MGVYYIKATYAYEGMVEGASESEALSNFYHDLNDYYDCAESENVEEVELCTECDNPIEDMGGRCWMDICSCEEDEEA